MYAVVGCTNCTAHWLLEDPDEADSAECPRCGTRHRTKKLRKFYRSDDRQQARQVRAAILAERAGQKDAFDELPTVAEMEAEIDAAGVDDDEYLAAAGLDPEAVAAAGERDDGGSRDRTQILKDGVERTDPPTEAEIVAYATEHGVPAETARTVLERLVRGGEVSENRGHYRLL
jgi:predicted  nucleic acid-binding Zn-ribbon protein